MSDEIIREVWQIKDAIGKEVNYSLHSLGDFLLKRQCTGNTQVVTLPSKRRTVEELDALSQEAILEYKSGMTRGI